MFHKFQMLSEKSTVGLGRNQKARAQSTPCLFCFSYLPISPSPLSAGAAPLRKHHSRLSCCRKAFTGQMGVSLCQRARVKGESTSSEVAGWHPCLGVSA